MNEQTGPLIFLIVSLSLVLCALPPFTRFSCLVFTVLSVMPPSSNTTPFQVSSVWPFPFCWFSGSYKLSPPHRSPGSLPISSVSSLQSSLANGIIHSLLKICAKALWSQFFTDLWCSVMTMLCKFSFFCSLQHLKGYFSCSMSLLVHFFLLSLTTWIFLELVMCRKGLFDEEKVQHRVSWSLLLWRQTHLCASL